MRDARWRRVEELFDRAVELTPVGRDALLARECGDDDELRGEVEALLAHAASAGGELRETVAAAAVAVAEAEEPASTWIGRRLGPYRVVEVLAEGGMGTVYVAERGDDAYRRRVAVKLLRDGLGSPEAIARFRDERQILASLDHPSIVKLLDGGTTERGLPYLVMELVEGVPLGEHARELPLRARVELVVRVCETVQYAHQQLVVHRDLKPANILIDAAGVPKLLDFGIARLLDTGGDREARTRTGAVLLTVEFASPEQARGEAITVATDVYALGAILYHLLVGTPPQRALASMLDTLRAICEVEPPRPSIAAPPAARRELSGDLDNIVMKALQKAPAARYPSVAELADDLRRYLDGHPVTARAATLRYRAGKFVRRHRGALALATLVAGALAAATAISIAQARRARSHAALAREQTDVAEQQTRSLLLELARNELAAGRGSRALPYLAEVLRRGEDTAAVRFLLAEALRPLELEIGEGLTVPEGLMSAQWTPDGRTIAIAGWGGVMLLADPELRVRARLETERDLSQHFPAITPDGTRVVASAQASAHEGDREGESRILVWDTRSGALLRRIEIGAFAMALAVSDRRVVTSGTTGVHLWDLDSGAAVLHLPPDGPPPAVTFSGDGRALVIGRHDGVVEWRDVSRGAVIGRVAAAGVWVTQVRALPGAEVAAAYADGTVRIMSASAVRATLTAHGDPTGVVVSPSGTLMATVAGDGIVRLWDPAAGVGRMSIRTTSTFLTSIELSPDDRLLAASTDDDTFQVWDTRTAERRLLLEALPGSGDTPHSLSGALDVHFSPDGTRLLTTSGTTARLWRVTSAPLLAEVRPPFPLWGAQWSPDERWLAAVGNGAAIFDARTGALVTTLDVGPMRMLDAAWSRDGEQVVITGFDGFATVFARDGRVERVLAGHAGIVNGSVFSPDGARLVTCGDDGAAIVWDPATGERLATLPHPARVLSATWSADGTRVVTAGWDRTLRIWDVARGEVVRAFPDGKTQYLYATLSPDGRLLASAGHDGEVTVWQVDGDDRRSLAGHTGPATQVEWSPDGRLLASSADDSTLRIWDPATGQLLAERHHPGSVMQVWWSRDGERVMSVNHSAGVRVWSAARERRPAAELLDVSRARSPWRLDGTRLVREQ